MSLEYAFIDYLAVYPYAKLSYIENALKNSTNDEINFFVKNITELYISHELIKYISNDNIIKILELIQNTITNRSNTCLLNIESNVLANYNRKSSTIHNAFNEYLAFYPNKDLTRISSSINASNNQERTDFLLFINNLHINNELENYINIFYPNKLSNINKTTMIKKIIEILKLFSNNFNKKSLSISATEYIPSNTKKENKEN
jgi:hypothetical protein